MPDARALAIRAPIRRSVGLIASKSAGGDPHGDILGHVPREILSDIYAKVPTKQTFASAAEWIPGVAEG